MYYSECLESATCLDALEGATEEEGIAAREGADRVVVGVERDVDLEGVQVPDLDSHVVGPTEQSFTACA